MGIGGILYGHEGNGACAGGEECLEDEFGSELSDADKSRNLGATGFLVHSPDSPPAIYREGNNGDFDLQNDKDNAKALILGQVTSANPGFVIGYRSTLLDTRVGEGGIIPAFPAYTAIDTDSNVIEKGKVIPERPVIGLSCDGKKLFMAAVFTADIPTSRFVRDLYKRGACRVILLDSGWSTQFTSLSENGVPIHKEKLDPIGILVYDDESQIRRNINAIVAYNTAHSMGTTVQVQATTGGQYALSPKVNVVFQPNTFTEDVTIEYSPMFPHHEKGYAHVSRFYSLDAKDAEGCF